MTGKAASISWDTTLLLLVTSEFVEQRGCRVLKGIVVDRQDKTLCSRQNLVQPKAAEAMGKNMRQEREAKRIREQ
jgi:hypothetical protein